MSPYPIQNQVMMASLLYKFCEFMSVPAMLPGAIAHLTASKILLIDEHLLRP